MRVITSALIAGLSFSGTPAIAQPVPGAAKACSASVQAALAKPGSDKSKPVEIACSLTLSPTQIITMPIAFSGSAASGAVLDCNGATLDGSVADARTVIVRSILKPDGSWDVPANIQIRNCTIKGDVRIQGLGANGQGDQVRISSLKPGHTQRAQADAPVNVTLDNITFVANGGIPLYAAPGVTGMTVRNSRFTGSTTGTAIYLDAESARNSISANTFDIRTTVRELIAVDGSAENRIEGNTFVNPVKGGIFLYRNCGEGGTVRQQKPERNVITGNTFKYADATNARPAVWLGSRRGLSLFNSYCMTSSSTFLGSLDHRDGAQNNTVTGNKLPGGSPQLIVDDDKPNTVSDNQ